jgi:hypothetical protein
MEYADLEGMSPDSLEDVTTQSSKLLLLRSSAGHAEVDPQA